MAPAPQRLVLLLAAVAAAADPTPTPAEEGRAAASKSLRGIGRGVAEGVDPGSANQTEEVTVSNSSADPRSAKQTEEVTVSNSSRETAMAASATAATGAGCMCLFDMDRTLTGKQGCAGACPGDQVVSGVYDSAYGGGPLTLSQLAPNIGGTACGGCLLGVVSAGSGGSPAARSRIHALIRGGPMVFGCQPRSKPNCARDLANSHGVPPGEVFMFDDMPGNVLAFAGSGMNARQVSCASRDGGEKGYCGASAGEIQLSRGVVTCR